MFKILRSIALACCLISLAGAATIFDHDMSGNLVDQQPASPAPPLLANGLLRDTMQVSADAVRFTAVVRGEGPFTYEWRRNGILLTDQTGDVLQLPQPVNPGDSVTVTVSNAYGSVTSIPASLLPDIQEVVTREVGVHVGGIQTPEYQDVETREVGLFVGDEPDPPYREVATREVSVVVVDPAAPPRIEDFAVTPSPTGNSVTLDWSGYNEYGIRDVLRYDIYYAHSAFFDITGMVPLASVGAGTFTWTRSGLPEWQDHFFAVVPVDGLGNQVTSVAYSAAYILTSELATREVGVFVGAEPATGPQMAETRELGLFVGAEPDPPYRYVESREVGAVVADATTPAPVTGAGNFFDVKISTSAYGVNLDWTGYNLWAQRDVVRYRIYYSDHDFTNVTQPGVQLAGYSQNGLMTTLITKAFDKKVYFFAVVAEDSSGNFNPVVTARSTTNPMPGFYEYALNGGQELPNGVLPVGSELHPTTIDYNYSRSKAALTGGLQFLVEWSDNLSTWQSTGVMEQVISDDGVIQSVRAHVPRGGSARRFVRLQIVPPGPQP